MSVVYIKDTVVLIQREGRGSEEYSFSKKDIITSSLDLKDVISYTFKLPRSLSKQELDIQAEIYFYENAGLDLSKKYKTFFLYKELDEDKDNYLVEAISISYDELKDIFSLTLQKTKFIDYISLSFMSFEKFYSIYKKKPQNDAFVYLDEKQSFISVFKNGEYVYAKTLPSLNSLLKNLNMDYDKFVDIISNKGLNEEAYDESERLIYQEISNFFNEYFSNMHNRFAYGKSVFYIDQIDNIYFYTSFKVNNLENNTSFWDLWGVNFVILPVEQFYLEKLSLKYNVEHLEDKINFTIFPRPPKIYKRRTFQLFLVLFLSFSIFAGDFAYRYYQNENLKKEISKIKRIKKHKEHLLALLKQKNKRLLLQKEEYKKEIVNMESQIEHIKSILISTLEYLDYPKTFNDLIIISDLLKKNSLKTLEINKVDNNYSINIISTSKNRDNISIFMKDLADKGYKNVATQAIENRDGIYTSTIRFLK